MNTTTTRRSIFAIALMTLLAVTGLAGCFGKKLTFGKGEVYYKDPVTEAEATKLGKFLKDEVKFFDDTTEKSVQLIKEGDTYKVRFVVKDGAEKEADALTGFGMVGQGIAAEVLPGSKVQIELCDSNLKTVKALDPVAPVASH